MTTLRTLIVEDSDNLRSALMAFLGGKPYITLVGEAQDGEEAIKRIEELDPDLLLLDLRMPKLDGWQVLQYLQERQARTKVIVLSGYASFDAAEAMPDYGVIAYIYKGNLLAFESTLTKLAQAMDETSS
jgi:two-component system response regulator YesN